MSLICTSFLHDLTGLDAETFTPSIIAMAEARAKGLLGFLAVETKVKTIYVYSQSKFLDLDELCNSVSKVEYRMTSGDFTEVETTAYRFIAEKRLILLDSPMLEDSEVQITLSRGWSQATMPLLVKFFLSILTLDTLDKFQPGSYITSEIDTKKIGDYMIKYKVSGNDMSSKLSTEQLLDQLVCMIKQGSFEPTSLI